MEKNVQFEKVAGPGRVILLAGLALTTASFWIPRDAPLHGGGGATLGLAMIVIALTNICSRFESLLLFSASVSCIAGGVAYNYNQRVGFIFSLLGIGLSAVAILGYVYRRAGGAPNASRS